MAIPTLTAHGCSVLDAALSGQSGPAGLRELANHPLQHGLAELLRRCLPGTAEVQVTKLLRTKYKPDRKLTAHYELTVDGTVRQIALSWLAEPVGTPVNSLGIDAEAARRGLLSPFSTLAATADNSRATLLIAPADPVMPQLVRLNDPEHLAELVAALTGANPRPAGGTEVRAIRYRPGQRHVLRVATRTEDQDRVVFIKIDREDRGIHAVRVARHLAPILAAECPGAEVVEPLAYSAADRAALWSGAPGVPLWQRFGRDAQGAARSVALVGRALRVMHTGQGLSPGEPLAAHSARAELASTVRAGEHIAALLPGAGAEYRTLTEEVMDHLDGMRPEAPSLVYGDAKSDNIVAHADRICLLDLDRCGSADPALDLGKFLADLSWWSRALAVDARPLCAALVAGYGACDPARWKRARLLAVLFSLKLAARRHPVHEVGWEVLVRDHLAEASARLTAERTR